jgi:hypothetical protein
MASHRQSDPVPAPAPAPLANRPGVRWVIRTAKSLLWVMAFAEGNPAAKEGEKRPEVDTPMKLVKAPEEGVGRVDWSEGW